MKTKSLLVALFIGSSISSFGQAVTYNYTGTVQTYVVPPCVFTINVQVAGAQGGGPSGGLGATVTGTLAVTPGQVLEIRVGGQPTGTAGGYNGGGNGLASSIPATVNSSFGGGGASDIRIAPYGLANRVAVGGGGGGRNGASPGNLVAGGIGGCATGGAGAGSPFTITGGTGGTLTAGGNGGPPWGGGGNWGMNGSLGQGGNGAAGVLCNAHGGGGGGGVYGGGGGGSDGCCDGGNGGGAGGGGSSMAAPGGTCTAGNRAGNGQVIITPVGGTPTLSVTPSSPSICSGASVTLTATSSVTGFTWSPATGLSATTGASVVASPTTTTTYTVTVGSAGCTNSTTVTVNIETPVIDNITVTDALCNGSSDGTITITSPMATQYSIDGGTTFQPSNTFTVPAGTYPITVQSALGCQATGTAIVGQPAPQAVIMGSDSVSCFGACDGTIVAFPSGGTAPYTFVWSIPGSGNVPSVSGVCAGSYTVTITDVNNCIAVGNETVGQPPQVVITSVVPTQPTCNGGNNGSLVINALGGTGVLLYSIDGGSTYQTTNTFTGLTAGTYNVIVKDGINCTAAFTAVVGQPAPVSAISSSDLTICIGQNANISVSGSGGIAPYTYAWDNGLPAGNTHTVSPINTTIYNVQVTDVNGCGPAIENVVVTVHPPLNVVASPDVNICPEISASISAVASGGNGGPYTYSWAPGGMLGPNQTVLPATNTTYTVTVTDGCGTPSAKDSVVVNVLVNESVTFNVDTTEGCSPVVVNLSHDEEPGSTCLWNFGDGTTSNVCDPQHTFTDAGCYNVGLTVTKANGCVADTVMNNLICVYAIPNAAFSYNPIQASVFNTEITFTNLTIGGNDYTWNFDSLGSSNLQNPIFEFPGDSTGNYLVTLIAVSDQGCLDTAKHVVTILDEFLLYVPTAFTPNADGKNDYFLPRFRGEDPESFEFYIFNRWGQLVFQTTDVKTLGWDGTHNGIKAKEDVYVWKIKLRKETNQDKREFFGHFSLMR